MSQLSWQGGLGPRFAERDRLKAQIAEKAERRRAASVSANTSRSESRARPAESADEDGPRLLEGVGDSFKPTDTLKRLYREIAKLIHPDLTTDSLERDRRNRVMAEANEAFSEGNEARLKSILEEWETSPEFVEGEGIGAELIRTIRKIHQVRQRLGKIEEAFDELKRSDWYDLKQHYDGAQRQGRDLFVDATEALDVEIAQLRSQLETIVHAPRARSHTRPSARNNVATQRWTGPRPRVLVVEDQPRIRELIRKTLMLADYDVDVASDGPSAIKSLRLRPYDMLTVELRIAGADGLDVIREAKRLRRTIAVVIITGHPSQTSALEAINLGVAGYITKPFKVPQLLAAAVTALLRSGWTEETVHRGRGKTEQRDAGA